MMHLGNIFFPFIIHFLLEASWLFKETSVVRQNENGNMHLFFWHEIKSSRINLSLMYKLTNMTAHGRKAKYSVTITTTVWAGVVPPPPRTSCTLSSWSTYAQKTAPHRPRAVVSWPYYTVTCRVLVTKMTGSSSNDWICWHFGYNLS
jgi:hypothetical protein